MQKIVKCKISYVVETQDALLAANIFVVQNSERGWRAA